MFGHVAPNQGVPSVCRSSYGSLSAPSGSFLLHSGGGERYTHPLKGWPTGPPRCQMGNLGQIVVADEDLSKPVACTSHAV